MSVSLSVTWFSHVNMAEWIKVLLGVATLGDPGNIVLDVRPHFLQRFNVTFTRLLWQVVYMWLTAGCI